jgi:zinc/manganese transport system substrate-binding protein
MTRVEKKAEDFMKPILVFVGTLVASLSLLLAGCAPPPQPTGGKRTIVVTYSVLGSLVKDLVGEQFDVVTSMPNGLDPHEWEPSAKDIETLNHAALIVRNGLGLEGGMEKALAQAEAAQVPTFTASQHMTVRTVKAGQGLPTTDPDQAVGAKDPHLWLDPQRMKAIVLALAAELKSRFGTDLEPRANDLANRLDALDAKIKAEVALLPEAKRLLVTGHESLGYFAEAYGFTLVGAIIPSLNDQAEVSAADLAALKQAIGARKVAVIFTELGTPLRVTAALGKEVGLKVVEITTHALGPDGSYFTFLETLSQTLLGALQN